MTFANKLMIRLHPRSQFDQLLALLLLPLLLIVPAGPAHGGEIILLNGDRLSGDIIERTVDAIVIEHTALGRIEVPIHSIRVVRTTKVLLPSVPGAMEVQIVPPDADLESPRPDPDDAAEPDQAEQDPEPEAESAEAERVGVEPTPIAAPQRKPSVEWRTQLELGLSATAGTSETVRFRSSIRTTRNSPRSTFRFDATYRYAEDRSNRTQNALTTGMFTDWPFPDTPWSVFAQGRYDYSEFQSWDHRLSTGGGFGYRLFDLKRVFDDGEEDDYLRLNLRGGAGLRKEWGSRDDDLDPEGIAGFDLGWRMNQFMRLEGGSTYFPTLNRLDDYRIVSNIDWIIDIDWLSGTSIKIGASHEYNAKVDPGISRHDLSIYGTLMINF
jgi:hypothetical protein